VQSVVINLSLFAVLYYFVLADDVEEEAPAQHESSKAENKLITAKVGQELAEGGGEDEDAEEDENEVQVPDTIPEDAYFIPLGFARQRPQTFYKGSDPEWQSFMEFSRDQKRGSAIRSKFCLGNHLHSQG